MMRYRRTYNVYIMKDGEVTVQDETFVARNPIHAVTLAFSLWRRVNIADGESVQVTPGTEVWLDA